MDSRNSLHNQANELLSLIAEAKERLELAESHAESDLERVRQRHAPKIAQIRQLMDRSNKQLKNLMKKNVAEVFDGKDQVDLDRGILLHGQEDKVTIPRDALEKIEEAGWDEAIIIDKKVKREVVEQWPVERLTVIGAKKRVQHSYNYELKR